MGATAVRHLSLPAEELHLILMPGATEGILLRSAAYRLLPTRSPSPMHIAVPLAVHTPSRSRLHLFLLHAREPTFPAPLSAMTALLPLPLPMAPLLIPMPGAMAK